MDIFFFTKKFSKNRKLKLLQMVFQRQHVRAMLVTKVPWMLHLRSAVKLLRLDWPIVTRVYVSCNPLRYLQGNILHPRFELHFHRRRPTKDSKNVWKLQTCKNAIVHHFYKIKIGIKMHFKIPDFDDPCKRRE